jgi:hypothetical protein
VTVKLTEPVGFIHHRGPKLRLSAAGARGDGSDVKPPPDYLAADCNTRAAIGPRSCTPATPAKDSPA